MFIAIGAPLESTSSPAASPLRPPVRFPARVEAQGHMQGNIMRREHSFRRSRAWRFPTTLLLLTGLLATGVAHAGSVAVEYRLLGEGTIGETVTQSLELRVTNVSGDAMIGTAAAISAMVSVPVDPLGAVTIGDVPDGFTASRLADIRFSVANESTVRSAPLSFKLTFFDTAGRPRTITAIGNQVP